MSTTSRDDLLARLLDQLVAQSRAGQRPDIEAVIRQHPELAVELRELWGAVMVADAVAAHSSTVGRPTPTNQALTPGIELPAVLGDYELLAELGRGGMGVVYQSRQISLGRIVALKMILR